VCVYEAVLLYMWVLYYVHASDRAYMYVSGFPCLFNSTSISILKTVTKGQQSFLYYDVMYTPPVQATNLFNKFLYKWKWIFSNKSIIKVYCMHLVCTTVSTILLHNLYLYCIFVERFWPLKSLGRCPECHQECCLKEVAVTGCKRVLITSKGIVHVLL